MIDALDRVLAKLENVRPDAVGHSARCPAHADERNSLHVAVGSDGRILLHCHAGCDLPRVLNALGLGTRDLLPGLASTSSPSRPRASFGKIAASYDYLDEGGALVFQVVRDENKNFRQRKPTNAEPPAELWTYSVEGVRKLLYRLPEVKAAIAFGLPVYVVEGEKDADNLAAIGLTATTNSGGAGKWTKDHTEQLAGAREVIVVPDNDEPGRRHADGVAASLASRVVVVKVLSLPSLPEKGDVSDFLALGHEKADLEALADSAPVHVPPEARFVSVAVGMADFLQRRIEKPVTILDGVFSAGEVGTLIGRGGAGKSWLGLQAARAIARGESWFGIATPAGGTRTGILELEDHAHHYQQRLAAIAAASGGSDDRDNALELVTRPDLQGPVRVAERVTVEAIARWIEQSRLRVLVLDALKDAHDANEIDNREMGLVMESLTLLASRTGCAVVFLHHEPKPQGPKKDQRDDLASVRGAARIGDDSRFVLRVVVHESGLRKLVFVKVSHGAAPAPIWLRQDPDSGLLSKTEAPHAQGDANRERVRETLLKIGARGAKSDAVAREVRLAASTVKGHLAALETEGKARRTGNGKTTLWWPVLDGTQGPAEALRDA